MSYRKNKNIVSLCLKPNQKEFITKLSKAMDVTFNKAITSIIDMAMESFYMDVLTNDLYEEIKANQGKSHICYNCVYYDHDVVHEPCSECYVFGGNSDMFEDNEV